MSPGDVSDALDLVVVVELTLSQAVAAAAGLQSILERFGDGVGEQTRKYLAEAATRLVEAADRVVADLVKTTILKKNGDTR